jgi:Domain of Unknown Function (DUF1080)
MRIAVLVISMSAAAILGAQNAGELGYTDTPVLPGLPYHVHDPARPHPRVVTPAARAGGAPSDAIVLFDGRDLSQWQAAKLDPAHPVVKSEPAPWKVGDGYFEVAPRTGDIATREKFGDVQLHLEWAAPADIRGSSQNRGNSGVFLQGRFEIQVLDSYRNPTYADGQAGAIYGQWPPLVNPTRPPGEWQSYDIVFEAPRFENGTLVKPAYLTVFLNGVLLHNRQPVAGPTVHRALAKYVPQPAEDALMLQDHGAPVRYRNIWIRRLSGYDGPERQ